MTRWQWSTAAVVVGLVCQSSLSSILSRAAQASASYSIATALLLGELLKLAGRIEHRSYFSCSSS